jgi:hypothetical protein
MARSRLRIPPSQVAGLAALIGLTEVQREELLRSLQSTNPTIDLEDLSRTLSTSTSLDFDSMSAIVDALVSLHGVRENFGLDVAELVSRLQLAIEESHNDALQPKGDWSEFQQFLSKLLSGDGGLTLTAKALYIAREHQNLFCTARVLTDLRPVFGEHIEEAPAALVPVHTLRITYHEGAGPTKDFFVALDRADLMELSALLERAIKKEQSLKKLTEEKGVTLLEVKA